jgi:molybdopterin-guanine dinucleotide biosynthesis protein A
MVSFLSIAIQAGGESKRMGQNKALLPFLGQPLIMRVIQRVLPVAQEVLVTTNEPAKFEFTHLPLFPDITPGYGALGGLLTAMQAASQPCVAVVACDMPFVNAGLISAEFEMLNSSEYDIIVPRSAESLEPFHAVYRRETCLPAIRAALDANQLRIISWFPAVQVKELSADEVAGFDPNGLAFLNVNTPTELAEAERLALVKDG